MARQLYTVRLFNGGIAESKKQGSSEGSFYFGQNLNIYGDPTELTINPALTKVSGSTVVDLVKWIVPGTPHVSKIYYYGDTGRIYESNTSGASWSSIRTVSNSGGQGLEVHNDYLYYTQDSQIGRYGLLSGSPSFTDNWQTGLNNTSTTDLAPIKAFKEGFGVGHGNYLGWWDGSTWDVDRLILPAGYNIRSLEVIDEFLAIGTWRGTSITDSEDNYVFFWDGSATTFNFFVQTDGPVNAMVNNKNRLMTVQGSQGNIYFNYAPFSHIETIPFVDSDEYVEVLPGAMSNWLGLAHIGVGGNTDSANVYQGVYQYGSASDKYAEAFNFGYTISEGVSQATTIKVGAVKGIGNQLYASWKNGSTYGVDRVTTTSPPYTTATYQGLILDDRRPAKQKLAITLKATHLPLVSAESIQLGYKTNRASIYTTGTANSTVGSTETRLPIQASKARYNEFQFEVILGAGSTSPTVTSLALLFDDLSEELII